MAITIFLDYLGKIVDPLINNFITESVNSPFDWDQLPINQFLILFEDILLTNMDILPLYS